MDRRRPDPIASRRDVLPPDPPRVPLGGRRRLHRPGADRPARRATASSAAQARRGRRRRPFANPLAPKPPPLPAEGQERHLPVHVRRAEPGRHVRLQARSSTSSTARRSPSRRSAGAARRTRGGSSGRSGSSSSTASPASGSATCSRNLATCVDDIAFLHSMTADSPIHGSAMLQMNTGKILSGSPCLGSWVNYGLGQREREPARLRRHARPDRRADQRGEELVERLHAGDATRGRSSARPASRSST